MYGYNKNTMTVKNAMLNFADDVIFDTSEDSTDNDNSVLVDEEISSEIIDNSQDYIESSATYDSETNNYLTSETDEAGNTVEYKYDTHGNQTSIKDGNGNTTSYTYDAQGNVTSINGESSDNIGEIVEGYTNYGKSIRRNRV